MVHRRCLVALAAVLSLGSIAMTPGCDWLKSSGSTERSSPFLSSLSVSPTSVLCGTVFNVSFRYDDPQGDISQVQIALQRDEGTESLSEGPIWPENQDRGAGVVSFPLSFTCDTPGGRWLVSVEVVDDLGHVSNTLTGQVTLTSAGG